MKLDLNFIKNATEGLNLNINSLLYLKKEKNISNSITKYNNREDMHSNSIILSVVELDYFNKEKLLEENSTFSEKTNKNSLLIQEKQNNIFIDYFKIEPNNKIKMKKALKNKKIKKKLFKINNFLSKIFKNLNLSRKDFCLEKDEMKLIYLILKKKFFKKSSFNMQNIKNLKNLKNLIILIKNIKSEKRVEEMNKFIFKLTLKKLRKNFFYKNQLIQNEENEIKFFEEFFNKEEIDEKIKKKFLIEKNKKLNNSFLKILFQNENFKKKFLDYLENGFFKDYLVLIPKKFKKFLEKLKKNMKKNDIVLGINLFFDEFAIKKRIKYPWTSVEIKLALEHFKKLINNFSS